VRTWLVRVGPIATHLSLRYSSEVRVSAIGCLTAGDE